LADEWQRRNSVGDQQQTPQSRGLAKSGYQVRQHNQTAYGDGQCLIETDNLTLEFLDDNSFLWASERDGYRQLYWYEKDGKLKKQVAKGQWEITDYYGYNPKTKKHTSKQPKKEA
jgi:hypothetical protein